MAESTGKEPKAGKCLCPFCDSELDVAVSFCQVCQATILYCPDCGISLERGKTRCPRCGKPAVRGRPSGKPGTS